MKAPRFASLSLSRKLTLLFTLASGMALLVFAAALWFYQSSEYRRALVHEIQALAETMADSSAAALAFHDDPSAAESLAVLRAEPRVATACLYRDGGAQAAHYPNGGGNMGCPAQPGRDRIEFTSKMLTAVRTATLKGEPVGQLWLLVDLNDLYGQLRRLEYICIAVLTVALLFAAIVASRLQRLISGPILDLAAVASRVSELHDYSIRAPQVSSDELGTLVEKFNEMMEQVHRRDIALEQAQADLEERVHDRTRKLQDEIVTRRMVERDLYNAKEAAEESNRAKSAFLANMSHELRTPLNAVIGYSELLEEDAAAAGNESAQADLRCITAAGQHLLHLISDILDLSKIEAGRMDIQLEPASARSLILDVSSTVQPLAWKNGNEFVAELPEDDFAVTVDPIRFRQSLLNLLSNACKFTERGTVSLAVTRRTSKDRSWICFEVRDTGPGIAAEDMHKLFKAFSQVDSSATRKYGGTGLGLSISQRFCEMMGGKISVDSALGRGSVFTIHLPENQFRCHRLTPEFPAPFQREGVPGKASV